MGVMWRVAGVVLRASAVVAIWWAWEVAHDGGRSSDDMSGVAVLIVLTAFAVFVWGVIDGIRGPVTRAAMSWMSALLCLVFVPVVVLPMTGGQALGGPGLFSVVLLGGLLFFMVLVPAIVGAVVGAGLRVLMQKVA
jgi:hypothetical protein